MGMSDESFDDLTNLKIEAGVSLFDGQAYCRIEALGTGSFFLAGQLSPAEVRKLALSWLEAAEAAEHDAMLFGYMRDVMKMEDEAAAIVVEELRKRRAPGG
jgi:hypothetical protein